MAVAYDAASNVGTEAQSPSWTHTPTGTPRGVIVWVDTEFVSTDQVTSVTYGGTSMTEVTGSPLLKSSGEVAATHCFFLGTSVPTGAQTVSVTGTGQNKWGRCITVTADADTEIQDTDTDQSDSATASAVALTLGGNSSFVAAGGVSGQPVVGSVSPATGWTSRDEYDFGGHVAICYTKDTVGSSDVSEDAATHDPNPDDDWNIISLAVTESGGGGSSALPLLSHDYSRFTGGLT